MVAQRARLAKNALLVVAGLHAGESVTLLWQSSLLARIIAGTPPPMETLQQSDTILGSFAVGSLVMLVVTGVVFLRWIHKSVAVARVFGARPFRWQPGAAVTGFIIPFLNITRPYRIVRDIHDSFTPDDLPKPTARVRENEEAGYRAVSIDEPPPGAPLPRAWIGAWWALYFVGGIIGFIANKFERPSAAELQVRNNWLLIYHAVEIVGALLAVRVVTAVAARTAERFRRIRYCAPETLGELGIRLS